MSALSCKQSNVLALRDLSNKVLLIQLKTGILKKNFNGK